MKITSLYNNVEDCAKERPEPTAVVIRNNNVIMINSYSMILKWAKNHIYGFDQIRIYNNKSSNIADDIIIKSVKIKGCLWSIKYNQHI